MKVSISVRFMAAMACLTWAISASASSYKLKLHKVIDPETHMLAGSYLIPAGWSAKDEITWMPLNYGTPCVGKSTITSPDGLMKLETLSAISFNYGQSTMGRNGVLPPQSIGEFLAGLWSKENPGLQYQIVSRQQSPVNQQAGQFTTYGYDGMVELAFEKDGRPMLVKCFGRIDGYQTRPAGGAMVTEGQWTMSNVVGATAPKDDFAKAMKFYAISLSSFQIDPHFFQLILQVQKGAERVAYNSSQNALNLSRHLANNQSQISSDVMSAWEEHSRAADKMNEQFDDYIKGLDTFTDSNGQKVKLPNWHAHLYSDGQGDYFYSDEPNGAKGNFHELSGGG